MVRPIPILYFAYKYLRALITRGRRQQFTRFVFAFILISLAASAFLVVRSRAAGNGFYWPAAFTRIFASRTLPTLSPAPPVPIVSTGVVISQVYGGGGNASAPYLNDFIELFNRGSSSVNASGWSVQYTSAGFSGGTGTNLISNNFVHSLFPQSAGPLVIGIYANGGTATYRNNMVRLGVDRSGNSVTSATNIRAIYYPSGTSNFYFNSVWVGGSGVGTAAANTYAFNSTQTAVTRVFEDNIFVNVRSNATSGGKHYAVSVGGSGTNPVGLTINNNVYYASGTGTVFGVYNGSDIATLAAWKTAIGQDSASQSGDPLFINPTSGSTAVNLHVGSSLSPASNNGTPIGGITNDFDGETRDASTPDIGADEMAVFPAGTYTVGTSGNYATLSAAVADLNNRELTGPVTLTLLDASYPPVTSSITIGHSNGGLTIKPAAGVSPVISGSVDYALLEINGASNVTIDGSNTAGGTTRDLTMSNTSIVGATIRIAYDSSNDVFKNINAKGAGTDWFRYAVFSLVEPGVGKSISNNTIQNCAVSGSTTNAVDGGITFYGNFPPITDVGNIITGNTITDFGTFGIASEFNQNAIISNNSLSTSKYCGFSCAIDAEGSGGNGAVSITGNTIGELTSPCGFGEKDGIFSSAETGNNPTIASNFIFNDGTAVGGSDYRISILIFGTGGSANIYYNSIRIGGTGITGGNSYGIFRQSGNTATLNVKNNAILNTRSNAAGSGVHYGIFTGSNTNVVSDYNDILTTGTGGVFGNNGSDNGSDRANLTAWKTATAQDAHSISANPLFTSVTDLHINPVTASTSPVANVGTPIGGITTDIDGQTRNASTPDIGADEFTAPVITVAGGPLNFPNTALGFASGEQTYTVSGSNLVGDITVTAPSTDFEVSKTTGTGFGPAITFTQTGGNVPTQTVFVRFKPQSLGLKSGNVTNTSTGAITQNVAVSGTGIQPDVTFSASGSLAAGNYHDVTINNCGTLVTMAGNVTITGTLTINSCGVLDTGGFVVSGGGAFTLASGGTLDIHDVNGITLSGATGDIQLTGTRTFSSGANYVYAGSDNQAAGNGLPGTVANLKIANSGASSHQTVTGNANQVVTGTLEVQSGIYSSHSDYDNVQIDNAGTLSLAGDITVSGNWTNNGTFTPNGFGVTFDGAGAQTITTGGSGAGKAFAGFTVSKTSGTATLAGDLSAAGGLTITSGTFDTSASNFTIGTAGNVSITGGTFLANGSTINGGGNWGNTGTFTAGTSTVNLGGNPGTHTISGTNVFNNLTISKTGGGSVSAAGSTLSVTGLLNVLSGTFTSATAYNNVLITGTLALSGPITVNGNWTNNGTFTNGGFTVTFNGTANQLISGSTSTAFATLALSNTGVGGSNTVSLGQNISDTALNITSGIFDQGASFNVASGAVTVSSGATWSNAGTGDLILSGGVANAGTIIFNANGTGCPQPDDISITSSVGGTQRAWSGLGTFSMTDVSVQDQGGTAIIGVRSGTSVSGNGLNWLFVSQCTAYTWTQAVNTDWTNPANWSPSRTPAASDILVFGAGTPTATVTNVAGATGGTNETIAELHIQGSSPTFSAASGGNTLNVVAGAVNGFDINSLTLSGANPLIIKLGPGTLGTVSGFVNLAGGAHQIISNTASAITFQNNSIFATQAGFIGNAFGDGSVGNGAAGSIVFASGSTYIHNAGSSPFGSAANASVVTFQTGSEAEWLTSSGFQASGRIYANLVISDASVAVNVTDTGAGSFQFDDLTVNNTGSANSSLSFAGSGSSAVNIKGNIRSNGAGTGAAGTITNVTLGAGSGGIQIDKTGSGTITFDNVGNARSILFLSDATVTSGTTLALGRVLQMGLSADRVLTVNGAITPNVGGAGYVVGNLLKNFAAAGSKTFEVGTPNGYSPVDLNATAGTFPANFTVKANQGQLSSIHGVGVNALQRNWTIAGPAPTVVTANLTFHYLAGAPPTGDIVGTPESYVFFKRTGGVLTSLTPSGAPTSTTATINGVSSFSDWTLAEPAAVTPGTLQFSASNYNDTELNSGTHLVTITVTRAGGSDGAASVHYATSNGSATTAKNDYDVTVGDFNWTDGDSSDRTFTVTVHGDTNIEPSETVNLTLSGATGATLGSPNPATLTIVTDDVCTPPSTVYVNKAWLGTALGDDPDGVGPAMSFGCDSFATIQDGINGVTSGGTVLVAAGTYAESVLANKSVSILGPNAAINPNTGTRVAEAIVLPAAVETSLQASTSGTIFRVGSGSGHVDATIKGLTIDGHNASLTGGRILNGVEIDTGAGIVNSINSFDNSPNAYDTTMIVQNNIVQNLERYGVLVDNVPSRPGVTGNDVSFNKIDNLPSGNNFGGDRGRGIQFRENAYGSATFNVITRVNVGWQDDNYNVACPGAGTVVDHNDIHTYHRGVFHNLQYQAATNATITNNNFFVETAGDFPATTTNSGIELTSIESAVGATVTGNNSTGNVYGILLWNLPTTANITVSGGTLSGNTYGVWATSNDPQFGAGTASHSAISGVTITGATTAGVRVEDSPATAATALEITGNTSISNCATGISVVGAGASANIHDNVASIHDNPVGISVAGGSATITSNNIYTNGTSLQFATGASVTAHFNRIISTTTAIDNPSSLTLDLANNWWGCNAGPGNTGCGAFTGPATNFDPRIVLGVVPVPSSIGPGGTSTVTADMTHNSAGAVPSGTLPDMAVAFSATQGNVSTPSGTITAGQASYTFTSTSTSSGTACAMVDNQLTCAAVTVNLPSFTIDDVSHNEGDVGPTSYTFTVTKTGATTFSSSVNFTTVDGSATQPTDYTLNSGMLTFPASATTATQQITVLVNGDTNVETDEAFTVHLSGAVNASIGDEDGTGTIVNDDTDVSVAVSPTSVTEDGAPNLVYTFTRNGVTSIPLTVNFSVAGTATFGSDYAQTGATTFSSSSGTVTIGTGNTAATVTIDPVVDPTYEANETVALTVTSGSGYNVGSPSLATGTINNDDNPPTVLVVNSTADTDDGFCLQAPDGDCTLREAINAANANPDANTINFNIPNTDPNFAGGVFTIKPTTQLPTVLTNITIDGSSQMVFGGDTNPNGPEIVLNGSLSTGAVGLLVSGDNNTIKGLVVNGFGNGGILISHNNDQTPSNNQILNNYVGTNESGTAAVANTGIGVDIHGFGSPSSQASGNTVQGNVISGNSDAGLGFCDAATSTVSGNFIGTDRTGVSDVHNGSHGVLFQCAGDLNNTLTTNTIAFNLGDGIRDVGVGNGHLGNKFSQNSIFENTGLGINLIPNAGVDGVTPNDPGDADTGANGLQNFPIIRNALVGGPSTIRGTLNSTPSQTFTIELYKNPTCDSSGNGEGKTYLGSTTVSTGANGDGLWSFSAASVAVGDVLTATATDASGNTSEFSACFTATAFTPGTIAFTQANTDDPETDSGTHTVPITVTRTGGSDGAVSVDYAVTDGNATSEDYSASPASGTLTWPNGNSAPKTITMTVKGDTKFEQDEIVNITLSNAQGGATIGTNPATLKIKNDDAQPKISIDDVTHSEGNAGTVDYDFTVSLSNPSYQQITVNAVTADNSATTADLDYTGVTSTQLTFAPDATTQHFHVLVNGDLAVEPDEQFFVNLSGEANATILKSQGVGTIINDDTDVSVAVSTASVAEDGATNLVYTFTRNPLTSGPITVNFTVGGSADFATDYMQTGAATFGATSGTVVIPNGSTTATVTVDPTVDSTVEPDETVVLTVTSGTGYNVGGDNVATGTITNDDTDVTVAVTPASVAEDGVPNLVYTFTRTGVTSGAITANFSVGGTATFASDYTQSGAAMFTASSGTVSFGDGITTASVTIDPATDTTYESDETVILTVTAGTGYNPGIPMAATGTITNDDPQPVFRINNVTKNELNSGTNNFAFTVTKTGPTEVTATVNFDTADGNPNPATGGASCGTPGVDYVSQSGGSLSFPPSLATTTQTITIAVCSDTNVESNETFFVELSGAIQATIDPIGNEGRGTIVNDDVPTAITPVNSTDDTDDGTCNAAHCSLREAINTANLSTSAVGISFAIPANDSRHFYYKDDGVAGQVTNDPSHVLVTTAIDDASLPGDKDPDWPHSWWSILTTAALPTLSPQALVNIDGYSQGGSVNTLAAGDNAVLRIELTPDLSVPASTNGLNITAATATVSGLVINRFSGSGINAQSGTKTLVGNFIGTDVSGTLDLGNTGSGISSSSAFGCAIGGSNPAEVNVIAGNNGDGIALTNSNSNSILGNLIGTRANGASALGNSGAGISLTGPGSVANRIGGTNPGEGNTIAFNGADGVRLPASGSGNTIRGNSIFSNGATANDLGIDLGTDGINVNDAKDPDAGSNGLQNFPLISSALVTGSTRTITGTLNSTAGDTFTIDFYQSPSCDTSGNGEGKTYLGTITTAATDSNGDLAFTFHPAVLTIGQVVTATATSTGASFNTSEFSACSPITDGSSGAGDIQFTSAAYTVAETGATAAITLTRVGGSNGSISASFTTSNGTATAGSDYTDSDQTVTFGEGETSKTINVPIVDDSIYEGNETVLLALGTSVINVAPPDGSGPAVIDPHAAVLTITENDPAPTLKIDDVTHNEGNSGTTAYTFTVTKTGSTALNTSVDYATVSGSATAPSDFTAIGTTTLTLLPADTTKQFTVLVNGDVAVEPDEAFSVHLSNPVNATISDADGTGAITNDDTDVTVAVSPSAVAEDGAPNLVYTFTRTGVVSSALTVSFSVTGTAAFGTDYAQSGAATFGSSNGTVTFGAGNSTTTLTIDPTVDSTVESDETVILTVTSGTNYNAASPSAATGTITNDDTDVSVAVSPASVSEDGVANLVYTFTRTGVTTGALTVNFSVGGTATLATDYTQSGAATFSASSGTVTIGAGNSTAAVTIDPTPDVFFEPNETVILTVTSGAGYNVASPSAATGTISNDDAAGGIIRFSAANYNTTESSGLVTITVERVGDTSAAATVDYATPDDSDAITVVPCTTVNGTASPRCDFTTALGTLRWAAGDGAPKTFNVLISQDNYVEGPETLTLTLTNLTGGAVFGSPSAATVTIADDATEPAVNPIDDASNFVRQQYHDFLNREPDASGLAFWTNEITSCGANQQCIDFKRVQVSAAFYISIEFQDTGYLVERLYKTAFGDANGTSTLGGPHQLPVPIVRFTQFLGDTQEIGQGVIVGAPGWPQALENNKVAFVDKFVQRPAFVTRYQTTPAPMFVQNLNINAGSPLSSSELATLISEHVAGTKTRAQVLRQIAEHPNLQSAEFNRAFVLMQYFGYLRRNPNSAPDADYTGFDFWLTKLNQFNGSFQNADMVKSFIVSGEYRHRSGQ